MQNNKYNNTEETNKIDNVSTESERNTYVAQVTFRFVFS